MPSSRRSVFGDPFMAPMLRARRDQLLFESSALRDQGVIPRGLRFFRCPAADLQRLRLDFPDRPDWAADLPGLETAMRRARFDPRPFPAATWPSSGIARSRLRSLTGVRMDHETPDARAVARPVAALARASLPTSCSHHLCFGTLGGWSDATAQRSRQLRRLARVMARASGRPVDYIHSGSRARRTLTSRPHELAKRRTKVYLVSSPLDDGRSSRVWCRPPRAALPIAAIAAPCSFGREPAPRGAPPPRGRPAE